jgi:hypothetical protein
LLLLPGLALFQKLKSLRKIENCEVVLLKLEMNDSKVVKVVLRMVRKAFLVHLVML